MVDINSLDLNLLRVFDTVYRMRNVSRAAADLGLSQPATSQALTRLRLALHDPLFERSPNGVGPTPRADRLARSVEAALAVLRDGLDESADFNPTTSTAELRMHLTDIGEARFLPRLMGALRLRAPYLQVQASTWPQPDIAQALDSGQLHFAIGYLPAVSGTARLQILTDRYVLLTRAGHPLAATPARRLPRARRLAQLDFVAVRTHSETLRILQSMRLEHRIKLLTSNFLALPAIVAATDLCVLMPFEIARGFEPARNFSIVELDLPLSEFGVSVHWSRRFEHSPMYRWLLALLRELFEAKR